ncbi:hypothetical protein IHE44_0011721 [Lamprotornis superbus]|uniref:Proline-serine-threonine phosphatase-interacting protein 2 n=1 Tax=Lamprotornis superbus TaxID=245042 RepID=A0A835NHY3_9PASS|nr:hypothetical protein IHE44_0011721 [Lamprotornis superbus]
MYCLAQEWDKNGSTDLTSTVGYDSIIQHLNDGRKNCKEFEDFLKESTLKRSLDVFKQQLIMEAIHKNRNLQYKKTMEAKRVYEQRCRDKDEAEQAFFETQECERINYFRNALWLHVNQLSLGCVQNDEKYEEIRKSLEMCSIEKDVDFFVNLRKTGSLAPAPVVYENYYNAQRNVTPARSPAPVPISRRGPLPTPTSAPGEPDYATVDGYSLVHF